MSASVISRPTPNFVDYASGPIIELDMTLLPYVVTQDCYMYAYIRKTTNAQVGVGVLVDNQEVGWIASTAGSDTTMTCYTYLKQGQTIKFHGSSDQYATATIMLYPLY